MLKVAPAVESVVVASETVLSTLASGHLNLTAYAKTIQPQISVLTKKSVTVGSIVTALSRLSVSLQKQSPLETPVALENLTVKSPICELVYEKTPASLDSLKQFSAHIFPESTEFLTVTQGTDEITFICSPRLKSLVLSTFNYVGLLPKLQLDQLVALSVRFPAAYQDQPNVIYALVRKLAVKKINIAEIVSTYTELTFVLKAADLQSALSALQ